MIAGIDYSSRAIDIVLIDDDTRAGSWLRIPLEGDTPLDRARSLRGRLPLRSWWDDHGVYLIGIEDPRGHHAHTAKALGFAGGAVAALLPSGIPIVQTMTAEWKRLTVGRGSATKEQVAAWSRHEMYHAHSLTPVLWPQDAYDAYAIARAVELLNNQAIDQGGNAA